MPYYIIYYGKCMVNRTLIIVNQRLREMHNEQLSVWTLSQHFYVNVSVNGPDE